VHSLKNENPNDKAGKKIMKAIESSKENTAEIKLVLLSSKESYAKELYFTLLSAVAIIDSEINAKERSFLSALIKGSNLNCEVSKIIDRSITAEKELIIDFLNCFGKDKLKYNFILNSLMMARIDDKINDKEASIIAELVEILEITKEEIMFLAELALAIMEKNIERFHTLVSIKPDNIDFIQFEDHLHSFIKIPNVKYVNSIVELEENELSGSLIIECPIKISKDIKIYDATIFFTDNGKMIFEEEIIIKIIKIEAFNSELIFNKCNNIIITDSVFKDNLNKRPLTYNDCIDGVIDKSKFINCDLFTKLNNIEATDEKCSGGAVYIYRSNVALKNIEFANCKSKFSGGGVYLYNEYCVEDGHKINPIVIAYCFFINCSSINGNGGGIYIKAHNTYTRYCSYGNKKSRYNEEQYRQCNLYCINNSSFTNCHAINGGGLWIDQPHHIYYKEDKNNCVKESKFIKCSADNKGGGAWIACETPKSRLARNGYYYLNSQYFSNSEFIESNVYIDELLLCGIFSKDDEFNNHFKKCNLTCRYFDGNYNEFLGELN